MKIVVLSLLILNFLFCKAQENTPSFIIKHDTTTNELSLWKPKKRNPETFRKINNFSFYNVTSDVGMITDHKLYYTWAEAAKNKHQISIKAYHKNRPNDIQTKRIQVKKPIKLALRYESSVGTAPGSVIPLYAQLHFNDGTTKSVNTLENSLISTSSKDIQIENGRVNIPDSFDINKTDIKIKATYNFDSKISDSITIPINYNLRQKFDYAGKDGYNSGIHGEHGKNVNLYIKQLSDSLVNILIKSNSEENRLIANLYTSAISLNADGGLGGYGRAGIDGERGRDSNDSRPAEDGYPGTNGGRGGDGGNGGFVEVFYQPTLFLADIQKLISISNVGGKGGRGGRGGSGGKGGRSDDNETILDVLFNANGGNYGKDGEDGDYGSNGKNGPPPTFTKLDEKEMDRIFEN